jgi:tryptophanyl-tRNA synthetase
MDRVFSGIQPSGEVHIGNYLGALRNWMKVQEQFECIYSVVDYHAITIDYDTKEMQRRILDLAAGVLACGVDPNKATLFVQSDVSEHTELAWVFNAVTPMGELSRQTQFKSKSEQHLDNINAGLFTYPVLQSADILLYKANKVPVGQDQEQHLELSREIARKFNARFGKTFPEARTMFTNTPKIVGLDGQAKMSKSLGNTIRINAEPAEIKKKLSRAFTDPKRLRRDDPGNPDICNVYNLHGFFTDDAKRQELGAACRKGEVGCVDCKGVLCTTMTEHLNPIRERWQELKDHPQQVQDVLDAGRDKCKAIAADTMGEVREKLGLKRGAK